MSGRRRLIFPAVCVVDSAISNNLSTVRTAVECADRTRQGPETLRRTWRLPRRACHRRPRVGRSGALLGEDRGGPPRPKPAAPEGPPATCQTAARSSERQSRPPWTTHRFVNLAGSPTREPGRRRGTVTLFVAVGTRGGRSLPRVPEDSSRGFRCRDRSGGASLQDLVCRRDPVAGPKEIVWDAWLSGPALGRGRWTVRVGRNECGGLGQMH